MNALRSTPKSTRLKSCYSIKLSNYAKLFYVEWMMAPKSHVYNVVMDKLLHGRLDVVRLRQAIRRYIDEHVVLNSHVQEIKGTLYWVKNKRIDDIDYVSHSLDKKKLLNYVCEPFNVFVGPLYRFKLMRIRSGLYRFIIVFHHLVVDGSCLDAGLFDSLSKYYNDDKYVSSTNIEAQIKQLVTLEKRLDVSISKYKQQQRKFWCEKLANLEKVNFDFLRLNHRPHKKTLIKSDNPISQIRFEYDQSILFKLAKVKAKYDVTPYVYGLSVFALLLYRYTGQNKFAVSYPIAIKEARQFIYGAQLNTNLIPFHIDANKTIASLFSTAGLFFNAIKMKPVRQGYYSIASIMNMIDKSFLDVCFIQTNLRDSSFNFQGINKVSTIMELYIDSVNENTLLFEQEIRNNNLYYRVRYNKETFDSGLLKQFVSSYRQLFIEILNEALFSEKLKKLSEYCILSKEMYAQVVYGFNSNYKKYNSSCTTIQEAFEAQVKKTPHNVALLYSTTRLSYRELNYIANRLARYLLRFYVMTPGDIVAICLDKNEYLIIAILAILKAGGAYVPLDPNYPNNRINHILNDTQSKLILTNHRHHSHFRKVKHVDSLVIDSKSFCRCLTQEKRINLTKKSTDKDLSYVLYTSGTTGKPKGVLQTHQNILSLFAATHQIYHFNSQDVWVLFHECVFDFSVWEMWGALLHGARLVIPTIEQTMNPHLLYQLCYFEKVTVLNQTPQVFYQLEEILRYPVAEKRLTHLRYIIFGGDKLDFTALKPWFQLYADQKPKLVNMYGITETTIHTTYKFIKASDLGKESIIGTAIPDQTIYVLDRLRSPSPIGAIGELYVGGAGLSIGYLNSQTLTSERFIANPFQTIKEKKTATNTVLYKTGDLARWLPSGELEYIGRNDSQIKIKGCRVELDDISKNLLTCPDVKQAIVISKSRYVNELNADDRYLVAYYVSKKPLREEYLLHYLGKRLPDYMCPKVYVHLKSVPLTSNGKINHKALPEPTQQVQTKYKPPTNQKEEVICHAFTRVLGIKPIGIKDDFFELGGDSLSAIQLTSLLQGKFSVKVADIFNLRTPKNIAQALSFSGDVLRQTLEKIKILYKEEKIKALSLANKRKQRVYLSATRRLNVNFRVKQRISNVLLTGATGYLGCNLLHQLLKNTKYKIYILVRANTEQEAAQRIEKKYKFYFDEDVDAFTKKRLVVIRADLEKKFLGLRRESYNNLALRIDSVIHAAALVKHYGSESMFYSANVKATMHLLKFSKLARRHYFHHISTISVLDIEYDSTTLPLYTENDLPAQCVAPKNIYARTKLQAERQVVSYRKRGVKTNIYRVGNLAFMQKKDRLQKNKDENAFLNWMKCLLMMKSFTKELSLIEISPADYTADAIIRIFDKKYLCNHNYHILNPKLVDLRKVFISSSRVKMKMISMDIFIDKLLNNLKNVHFRQLTLKLLLRQGWLDGKNIQSLSGGYVLQARTDKILRWLGFEWPSITLEVFNHYIDMVLE